MISQHPAFTHHKPRTDLDVDAVAAGCAGGQLVQQLLQLGGAGRGVVCVSQPVAQHIGLARRAELAQWLDGRWCADRGQVLRRNFDKQFLRLRRVPC